LETNSPFWLALVVVGKQIRSDAKHLLPENRLQQYIDQFLSFLANRLNLLCRQCLVFECSVIAEAAQANRGSVDDLAKFYRSSSSLLINLLDGYPELEQILCSAASQCISFSVDTATRIHDDLEEACQAFGQEPRFNGIKLVPSDSHAGGRTVIGLLDSFGEVFVALKPRCLRLEAMTTSLLATLCKCDERLKTWKFPSYLVKDGYGWAEWIPPKPCETEEEVSLYYFRAGCLLAFATALGITDLHRDNLISCGPSPIPIDLEATLHHRKRPGAPSRHGNILPKVMEWNVLGTGLLPIWLWKGEDLQGVDLSALGSVGDQYVSIPLQQFVSENDALERMVRTGVVLRPPTGSVRLLGDPVQPWRYISQLLQGFEFGCSLSSANRNRLLAFFTLGKDLRSRFLARPTAGYHYVIQASLHPLYLRSSEKRIAFLRTCLKDEETIPDWMFVTEVDACRWGDIPRFTSRGSNLFTEEEFYGGEGDLFEVEFEAGPVAAVRDVDDLTYPEYLQFNKRLIRGSMLSLQSAHEPGAFQISNQESVGIQGHHLSDTDLVKAEHSAAEFLVNFVSEQRDPELWFGFRASPEGGGHYEFGVIGPDFYSGSTGVIYALSALRDRKEHEVDLSFPASCITATVNKRLLSSREKLGGAYFGTLSAILPLIATLHRLGKFSMATDLISNTRNALQERLSQDDALRHFWGCDLVGGLAGALAVAVVLHRHCKSISMEQPISHMVRLFAENATTKKNGVVWEQPALSKGPDAALTGLSHGQIGCALALAEVAALNIGSSLSAAELSKRFLEWELSQFSAPASNWPDYRFRSTTAERGEVAWSHGWPGILLAIERIGAILPCDALTDFRQRYPMAGFIQRLTEHPKPLNHSLCHGSIGSYCIMMDMLTRMATSNENACRTVSEWTELGRWHSFETRPFRQNAIDPPGCMVGRAGSLLGWHAVRTKTYSNLPMLPHRFERLF